MTLDVPGSTPHLRRDPLAAADAICRSPSTAWPVTYTLSARAPLPSVFAVILNADHRTCSASRPTVGHCRPDKLQGATSVRRPGHGHLARCKARSRSWRGSRASSGTSRREARSEVPGQSGCGAALDTCRTADRGDVPNCVVPGPPARCRCPHQTWPNRLAPVRLSSCRTAPVQRRPNIGTSGHRSTMTKRVIAQITMLGAAWTAFRQSETAAHSDGSARPKPRRQSRYVTRLPAILAELGRIVHR
jgi:hypothetical protein